MSSTTIPAQGAGGHGVAGRAKVPLLQVDIVYRAGAWRSLGKIAGGIRRSARAAHLAAVRQGKGPHRVAVVIALSNGADVRALNSAFRGKDKDTNVLSFPAPAAVETGPSRPLGDVILSYETVVAEASERGMSPVDHLQHLVVHGVLHLLGYDHVEDGEAALMEGLESQVMLSLGMSDPYVDD